MRQLEEALMHARKEEKEATSARRALEGELMDAQVNTAGCWLHSFIKEAQGIKNRGTSGDPCPSAFNYHSGLVTVHPVWQFLIV